jgi:hypothetical protein
VQHTFQPCIDACNACAQACDACASACLREDDVKMLAACIRTDLDCAAVCRMAASFMGRGSEFVHETCRLCGQICAACAAECARHDHDHCQRCAAACRRCADECRKIVEAVGGGATR